MSHPLDFAIERDEETTSWRRADPTAALIERTAWNHWRVTLLDGEDVYDVYLETDHGAYLGACHVVDGDECPGFKWHDGPCAHLCTVRKAAVVGIEDVNGTPVRVFDRTEIEDARADQHVERVVADGGRRLITDGGQPRTRRFPRTREARPPVSLAQMGGGVSCTLRRRPFLGLPSSDSGASCETVQRHTEGH